MGKKDNFGRAMQEMFGVGRESSEEPMTEESAADLMYPTQEETEPAINDFRVEKVVPVHAYNGTYLAAGTMMKGTLSAKGDVEIAGDFEGEILAKGKVTIHSNINSRISANGLVLVGCSLTGDVEIAGDVSINEQSVINGNVRAENMVCSGTVKGDLDIQDNLVLDEYAQIDGNIKVDTISVARGAKISGNIEMRSINK